MKTARKKGSRSLVPVLAIIGVAFVAPVAERPAEPGSPSAEAPPGGSSRTATGVYTLQQLINFDSLEGAQFDPVTKTLVLFGRRARPDRTLSVPYLDYLAAAMESNSPTFTLQWLQASRQQLRAAQQNPDSLNIFDSQQRLNALGTWVFRQAGVNLAQGASFDAFQEKVMSAGGLQKIFANKVAVAMPTELARAIFSAEPKMTPVVKGMPVRSLMAQVALDSDVQSKSLATMPELKGILPGYQTYGEWERVHTPVSAEQHTWLAPDRFEIKESTDGQVMRFGQTRICFHMEKYVGAPRADGTYALEQSVADSTLSGYADMLTRNYDALAAQFSVFHQLREAFKVLAVANWMSRHGWRIDLPARGRIDLDPPAEVHGIVDMEVSVRAPTDTRLVIHNNIWITGGIDLRVEDNSSVVKLPDLGRLPIISPSVEANEEIRRILRHKTEVPLPEISGWSAQAHAGKEATDYVALRGGQLSACRNAAELQPQLERVRHDASMLGYYDRQINVATSERVQTMSELQGLKSEAERKRIEYLHETAQVIVSLIGLGEEIHTYSQPILLLPARESTERIARLNQIRTLLGDLKTGLERSESPTDYNVSVGERLAELANEIKRQWDLTNPQTWLDAREMAARRSLLIAFGAGVITLSSRILDLQGALQTTDELNQKMGDAAQQAKSVKTLYEKYVNGYRDERNKLDTMMRDCK